MPETNTYTNLYKVLSGLIANVGSIYGGISGMKQKTDHIILTGSANNFLAADGNYHTVTLPDSDYLVSGDILNGGLIKSSLLPSYVDDVIEGYYYSSNFYTESGHATSSKITGETGKIYVDLTSNSYAIYRYSGTAFIKITDFSSLNSWLSTTSGNWQKAYTTVNTTSSNWQNAYTAWNSNNWPLVSAAISGHIAQSATYHVTQANKNTWNGKQDAITSSKKLDYSLISGQPNVSDTDFLFFKVPAFSDSNTYYDLRLTFGNNDTFTNKWSTSFKTAPANFHYGNRNGSTSSFLATTSYSTNGLPVQLSDKTIRYSLSSLRANATASSYNRFAYQWVKTTNGTTTQGDVFFGMINGIEYNNNSELSLLNDKIDELSGTVVSETNKSLDIIFQNANVTMSPNKWYIVLQAARSLTLPTTNVYTGDVIKVTANSTAKNSVIVGTIYGETGSGWTSFSNLTLDIPETVTLVYNESGSRWNLVESSRL